VATEPTHPGQSAVSSRVPGRRVYHYSRRSAVLPDGGPDRAAVTASLEAAAETIRQSCSQTAETIRQSYSQIAETIRWVRSMPACRRRRWALHRRLSGVSVLTDTSPPPPLPPRPRAVLDLLYAAVNALAHPIDRRSVDRAGDGQGATSPSILASTLVSAPGAPSLALVA